MTRKKDKRLKDETGNRYGKLVVLEYAGTRSCGGGGAMWKCKCDCGNETTVLGGALRRNVTRSCGCFSREESIKRQSTKNGLSSTTEYHTWRSMIARCHGKGGESDRKNYQERGIYVCDRWRDDFYTFLEDMGERTGKEYSLDRIDNNGPYSPENCRWATRIEQMNNKRNNIVVTYLGTSMTVAQLARLLGFPVRRFSEFVKYYHGDAERAVERFRKAQLLNGS